MLAYDEEPFSDVADVGPVRYAMVQPGLTIIVGEHGIKREANDVIADRLPEVDLLAPLIAPDPVNAGAALAAEVPLGEPMSEPPGPPRVESTRLTFDQIRALMRRKVEGRDGSPLSSGGGGRRRTKPVIRGIVVVVPDTDARAERWRVEDMTPGEREFYARRPGEALMVLRTLVGSIIRNEVDYDTCRAAARPAHRFAFAVYGLSDPERRILKTYRGAARRALIDWAHQHAHDWIAEIDRAA